jgi:hypothetical protein
VMTKGTRMRRPAPLDEQSPPPPQTVEEMQKLGVFVAISHQARRSWVQGQQRDHVVTTNSKPKLVTAGLRLGGKRANKGAVESRLKKKEHFF